MNFALLSLRQQAALERARERLTTGLGALAETDAHVAQRTAFVEFCMRQAVAALDDVAPEVGRTTGRAPSQRSPSLRTASSVPAGGSPDPGKEET